jgi:hypothetical protein
MIRLFAHRRMSGARGRQWSVDHDSRRSRALSVRDGTEGAALGWHDRGALATCAHCGGDRLIPLSFNLAQPDDGGRPDAAGQSERPDLPDRPVMKCLACGDQLYADEVVHSQTDSN